MKAVVPLLVLMLATAARVDATAAEDSSPAQGDGGSWIVEEGEEETTETVSGGGPAARGPIYTVTTTTVDGETCWMIAEGGSMEWGEAADLLESLDTNDVWVGACEFENDEGPTVLSWWLTERCSPPPPTPISLDPDNRAITGKAGYLTIRGERTPEIPCLNQVINAEARYVVHWGDGATTETTSQGGEWPDGDLTHVYEDKGRHTITVEAYWTGTVAGTTLPELPVPTTGSVEIQVDEVQAVVTEQH